MLWAAQSLKTVLEVTVFLFRTQLPPRSSVFPVLPFTLLLCNCTGINKPLFFSISKYSQIYSVFTTFSGLESSS